MPRSRRAATAILRHHPRRDHRSYSAPESPPEQRRLPERRWSPRRRLRGRAVSSADPGFAGYRSEWNIADSPVFSIHRLNGKNGTVSDIPLGQTRCRREVDAVTGARRVPQAPHPVMFQASGHPVEDARVPQCRRTACRPPQGKGPRSKIARPYYLGSTTILTPASSAATLLIPTSVVPSEMR